MLSYSIVIPCFNEGKRVAISTFIDFANNNKNVQLVFVNDGSTDDTLLLLEQIKRAAHHVIIIDSKSNIGKANAIREGLLYTTSLPFEYTGYLDADLSTSLNEFDRLVQAAVAYQLDFVLAARIKKIDTRIERSAFRHLVGRIIATMIDLKFKLGAYDTQCGAKVFKSSVIYDAIKERFKTKWFVDVELLLRIRKRGKNLYGTELPLQQWINKDKSKISMWSVPGILVDLAKLFLIDDSTSIFRTKEK